MKQHKWHTEIKAWADGAEIEWRRGNGIWDIKLHSHWYDDDDEVEYRIKPQPKEPKHLYVYFDTYVNRVAVTEEKSSLKTYRFLGKIKLEIDDE